MGFLAPKRNSFSDSQSEYTHVLSKHALCLLLVTVSAEHINWSQTYMADPQIHNLPKWPSIPIIYNLPKMIPEIPLTFWLVSTVISTGSRKHSKPQNCCKHRKLKLSLKVSLSLPFLSLIPLQLQQTKRS